MPDLPRGREEVVTSGSNAGPSGSGKGAARDHRVRLREPTRFNDTFAADAIWDTVHVVSTLVPDSGTRGGGSMPHVLR
jgi:hypothetical protein